MALPMLVGGADCGPSNPLQGLSKRFDQDRGIQQDYFGAGRAGSSRETFRTPQTAMREFDQEAQRFFSATGPTIASPSLAPGPSPFDLSALHGVLPANQAGVQAPPGPLAAWASDFLHQQQQQHHAPPASQAALISNAARQESGLGVGAPAIVGGMPALGARPWAMPGMWGMPAHDVQVYKPALAADQSLWDKEFQSHEEASLSVAAPAHEEVAAAAVTRETAHSGTGEADEVARAAGLVVECVKHEQNPKFQNSQFMGLMKQLRDRQVVVEGNDMVAAGEGWTSEFAADVKGKGRAVDSAAPRQVDGAGSASGVAYQQVLGATQGDVFLERTRRALQAHEAQVSAEDDQKAAAVPAEEPNEAYFRQDNEDYMRYWNRIQVEGTAAGPSHMHDRLSWDALQAQWEQFEATTAGVKPVVDVYQFQTNNPYLSGQSSRTRHHSVHATQESVLELEAAVQRDPTSAAAWFELGVKQQENEREKKAIQALQRSVQLDPMHLPAWLALAVSHTNDSNRAETYAAVREWVHRNDAFRDAVPEFHALAGPEPEAMGERFEHLIQCLITMARSDASGGIDADIQIALAVLMNANEDYVKAQDCFRTALAVRPHDWLLYNRVGATMANSGKAEEALQFYHRALELNPGYIRARFNLGISCINLARYEEAAHHILDALVLQESDSVVDETDPANKKDVASDALWETLRNAASYMHRADLAALCARRDLEAVRTALHEPS